MKAVERSLIEQRAYEIWEKSGCPHGKDKEHWAQAEKELLEGAAAVKGKAGSAKLSESKPKTRGRTKKNAVVKSASRSGRKQAEQVNV